MLIEKEEIKYINNDPVNGIEVDWDKVMSYYKMLDVPKGIYNPAIELDFNAAEWFALISTRSTGKTTNIILVAMILFFMYGAPFVYVRQREQMTAKQNIDKLFNVIVAYRYIEKLSNGEYNNVYYYGHQMYFIKLDETGKRVAKSEAFMQACGIDQHEELKSTLNLPFAIMILFDEFISTYYAPNEFVNFCDLLKTILRDRLIGKIFLCANTTDYYNEYLKELNIQDEVLRLEEDQPFVKLTRQKTRIFVHLISNRNMQRKKVNTLFFGFDNPKLAAITGGAWAIDNYQHIRRDPERVTLTKDFYIKYAGKILQIALCYSDTLGRHVCVHQAVKVNPKAKRIYTIGEIDDKKEAYKFGNLPIDKVIWTLYNGNRWYFSNNDVGFTVETYVNRANKL